MTPEKLYRLSDRGSGALIFFMIIFTPWAFGTTERWSINLMNCVGFTCGILLSLKLFLRSGGRVAFPLHGGTARSSRFLIGCLSALTFLLLLWCLVSAWNAAASYSARELQFIYRNYFRWLPHSFDARLTWAAFWKYAALACSFWSIRDWLLTRSEDDPVESISGRRMVPARLQWLLWALAINGTLVGIEGLVQRLDGGGKLLWLVQPPVNKGGESQFGPYAYRSNAAQYLNLVWPIALGLWAVLHRRHVFGKPSSHHLLLSCVMIMAACPLVSDSRAGAIVTGGCMAISGLLLVLALSRHTWMVRAAPALFGIATVALGLNLGWTTLSLRMRTLENDLGLREQMYNTARKITADYPWFGTGPGTFDPVFQLYRSSPDEYWPGQLHNDWLETLVTFGRIGFAIAFGLLLLAASRWFLPGGITVHWALPAFFCLSLGGCLLHARFDFPLQNFSVLFVFLLNCSILSCISRQP